MAYDALDRNESCGAHFREEYQTEENEAERNDESYKYVAAWDYSENQEPNASRRNIKNKMPLQRENQTQNEPPKGK